jgi:hypothetical protein
MPDELVVAAVECSQDITNDDGLAVDADEEERGAALLDDRNRFLATVQPLVERASRDAEGNPRLAHHYSRLTAAFDRAGNAADPPAAPIDAPPAAAQGSGPHDLSTLLRHDRASAADPTAVERRRETARALGETGVATTILTELFEGGRHQRLAARLSPEGRDDLLDAAQAVGFIPPAAWTEHPALGAWLARRRLETGSAPLVEEGVDERTLLVAAFEEGARVRRRLTERRLRRAEATAAEKAAVARGVAPVLEELDLLVLGYARVRRALERMGWEAISRLGEVVPAEAVDPLQQRIVGDPGARYVVRGTGVRIAGNVVIPATLERDDDVETEAGD